MNIRLLALLLALAVPVRAADITAVSPDKKVAVLDFDTGKIDALQIWNLRPWRRRSLVSADSHKLSTLPALSWSGRIVAWGCKDGTLHVFDARNGHLLARMGHTFGRGYNFPDSVSTLAFSPDGRTLASANAKGLFLWNWRTRKLLFSRPLWQRPEINERPYGPLRRARAEVLCFSPDAKTLALGGRFTSVFLFDVAHKRVRHVLPLHAEQGGANALAFSPNGKRLLVAGFWNVSGGSFEQIHLFGTRSGRRVWRWNNKSNNPLAYATALHYDKAAFSSDGRRFAVANNDSLVIRDARTARLLSMRHREDKLPSLEARKQLFPELVLP